ncbi:MAG: serine/threonine protein kinase [Comamonadaceae bacterium]|nr:MAG: serine/threonine protein kinase [Comamonadaceae bacterium]
MIRTRHTLHLLAAAGILASASLAQAQTAIPTTRSGEATTQTPAGEPNPTQRPGAGMANDRATVRSEARANNRNQTTTNAPGSGEASTKIMAQPNATPAVGQRTREEVRQGALHTPRPFGDKGERPAVPTNPTTTTGTPK